jgi:hypothetical protein
MPENGAMAVNTPLTASRLAACSTRSVHPRTLELLNRLVSGIGGTVQIINPYANLTKGEVCWNARQAMPELAVWNTVSCGRPHHRIRPNCGHCYPCLIRRAGLHAAFGHDDTDYAVDLADIDINGTTKSATDLRAFTQRVWQPPSIDDILSDIPLPADTMAHQVLDVVQRAHYEMYALLQAHRPDLLPASETPVRQAPSHDRPERAHAA